MNPMIAHRFLAGEGLPASERRDLVRTARRLQGDAAGGHAGRTLAGRHVAVAVPSGPVSSPHYFEEAATALGAHVSHLTEDALEAACSNAEWARMLGRLYDAVDCGRLTRDAAIRLEKIAGIPMFSGLGDAGHPVRQLLADLGHEGHRDDDEREALLNLVEAVLVATMA
jgi:ornithine carbamoyltransferase